MFALLEDKQEPGGVGRGKKMNDAQRWRII